MSTRFALWRRSPQAAVDDSAWVLARYEEAKELLAEIREDVRGGHAFIDLDLQARANDFWDATLMDRCTTMGNDCGCNTHA